MVLDGLRKRSNSETNDTETDERDADEEASGSRLGTVTKSLGVAVVAGLALLTVRRVRNRGSE